MRYEHGDQQGLTLRKIPVIEYEQELRAAFKFLNEVGTSVGTSQIYPASGPALALRLRRDELRPEYLHA
jgi:hypothetical protein